MRGMLYEGVHAGYVIRRCACGVCYTRVCMRGMLYEGVHVGMLYEGTNRSCNH